jgi:hypothetical protein
MNLSGLSAEIHRYVTDSSLQPYYIDWVNDAINELAVDYDFPALKVTTPANLSCNVSGYTFDLPSNYCKNLYKVLDSNYEPIKIFRDVEDVDRADYDHDVSGSHITKIAVMQEFGSTDAYQVMVYPKATEVLKIYYYRTPTPLVSGGDVPDFIPSQFHRRVIVPMAIARGYSLLGDMSLAPPHDSIMYWENKITEGLYGRMGGAPGLLNWFNIQRPPRRRGGFQSLP